MIPFRFGRCRKRNDARFAPALAALALGAMIVLPYLAAYLLNRDMLGDRTDR